MTLQTSARLLRLLSLLQARVDWSGPELAERLGVTTRTVRNNVERLRGLGYPVHATPGVRGGYRLGAGAALPRCCWTTTRPSRSRSGCGPPPMAP
jgi:predicted DNA-binding transcriptional regulator YafY